MKNLEFFNKKNLMSAIDRNGNIKGSSSELDKFKNEAVSISTTDEFKRKISNKLGAPRPNETKEQYVSRCKKIVMDELFKKLKLK